MLWATMLTVAGSAEEEEEGEPSPGRVPARESSARMPAARCSARSSMEDEGGTEGERTVAPLAVRAFLMPCQYWIGGRLLDSRSSPKPRSPWARTMGYLGVAAEEQCQSGVFDNRRPWCAYRSARESRHSHQRSPSPAHELSGRRPRGPAHQAGARPDWSRNHVSRAISHRGAALRGDSRRERLRLRLLRGRHGGGGGRGGICSSLPRGTPARAFEGVQGGRAA